MEINNEIPKIIHYVWVGNNKKDKKTIECIKSWKKYCHDYEFMEWGNNILKEIDNQYVKEAYQNKMYAFVSDYIRLYVLKKYGGIYLDTDIEITNPIDKFLNNKFFLCQEIYNNKININTAFIGAVPNNNIICDLLDTYKDSSFIKEDGSLDISPNPQRFLNYFEERYGITLTDGKNCINLSNDGIIYPYCYFCQPEENKVSYAIHHFAGSWVKERYTLLQKIFSIKNSKNKKHKIFTFLGIKFKIKKKSFISNTKLGNNIPKIIHYCWFGGNPKTELVERCIASWKKYLPDYEIREWNDNDLKNCKIPYVQEAYKAKKWAFITDYFRLYALYNYGGIYFDSDNEVFKSFDEFLNLEFFSGYENYNGYVSPFTAVVGAKRGNKIIKDLLDEYDDIHFVNPDGSLNLYTNTCRVTDYFQRIYNFLPPYNGNKLMTLEDKCIIYPSNIFCNYKKGVSYAVHHFNGSWLPENAKNKTDKHKFSLKDIFSVYNQNGHKVWNILGIKMKFRRK